MTAEAFGRGAYHILRFALDPITEEFVNVGIILYEVEKENPQIAVRVTDDWTRLLSFDPEAPTRTLERLESTIQNRINNRPPGIPLGEAVMAAVADLAPMYATRAKGIHMPRSFSEELEGLMRLLVRWRRDENDG